MQEAQDENTNTNYIIHQQKIKLCSLYPLLYDLVALI